MQSLYVENVFHVCITKRHRFNGRGSVLYTTTRKIENSIRLTVEKYNSKRIRRLFCVK